MGAPDVMGRLAAAGIQLTRNGDKLVAAPKECLDDDLRALIRLHKAELLAVLENGSTGNAELDGLIATVADSYKCPADERQLMIETARGDLRGALISFRLLSLWAPFRTDPPADDRVTCASCANLVRGRCQAAAQGLMEHTWNGYSPVPDVLRNCEHFNPKGH